MRFKTKLKQALKRTFLFKIVVWFRQRGSDLKDLKEQSQANVYHYSPVHAQIKQIAVDNSLTVFFETGTYLGNTVFGVKDAFEHVYSAELSEDLAALARQRFTRDKHVHIIQGDSALALQNFLLTLDCPALFWLDAHYSAGITAMGKRQTPVYDELVAILTHSVKGHHILVDDVKDFTGDNDYPTVSSILDMVRDIGAGAYEVKIDGPVFRIFPLQQSTAIGNSST
jgi:hypothetical protein